MLIVMSMEDGKTIREPAATREPVPEIPSDNEREYFQSQPQPQLRLQEIHLPPKAARPPFPRNIDALLSALDA